MSHYIHDFRVLLASTSPQRAKILGEMGISFQILASSDAEVTLFDAAETVRENAKIKVLDAVAACPDHLTILGADTVLSLGDRILGKPASPEQAERYLSDLSGRTVHAYSGVAVASRETDRGVAYVERAEIVLTDIPPEAIKWYVGTGEPLTRAGALGITLLGEVFVQRIIGAYSCVAGLPKRATLLACSDREALGDGRMHLDDEVASTLYGSWIVHIHRFAIERK